MKKKNNEEIEIIDDIDDVKINHKNKKKYLFLLLIIPVIIGAVITYRIIDKGNEKQRLIEEQKTIDDIKNHYNKFVKVDNKTSLLSKKNDEFQDELMIFPDVIVELDDNDITKDTKYFKLKDSDYYINYLDVSKIEKEEEKDNRYKNYLPFNENIVTKDSFILYDGEKEIYSFDKSMDFPIIIKDYEGKYYVEYNNRLLSIKKDDVKSIKESHNTDKQNQKKITTLAYHQVEDGDNDCKDAYVCIKKNNFDKEMKYLKDNNYFTLTMEELLMYLNGSLQVEKGIVLTFDDGFKTKSMIEILEKYDLMGTVFVITKHFDTMDEFQSKNLFVQSHTNNMHRNYVCSGGSQGGAILCATKDEIVKDLKLSIEKTGNSPVAMAFPFYDYNEKAISAVKEAGFKMSFVGRAGVMGKATPKVTDVYKIPRMTVWDTSIMSFDTWKSYL